MDTSDPMENSTDNSDAHGIPKETRRSSDRSSLTAPVNTAEDSSPAEVDGPASNDTTTEKPPKNGRKRLADGREEITEDEAYHALGFNYPSWKKWSILGVIFIVQVSMNFNASIYANGIDAIAEEYSISQQAARVGQMIFLVAYAFGSELWAPWSEEFGRWPILQLSLFFVNIWQIPAALAPNFATIVVARFLGGLSSAGGSVTLGMVADMWEADDQQYAVAFIVFSSVGGSVVGPIVGGFVQQYLQWRWVFWLQLIFGVAVQAIHFVAVPETRETILMDKEAKRLRKSGEDTNVYGPNEVKAQRITMKEVLEVWWRPFHMFVTEPIVLFLSLLSGFSDALIFTFLGSYTPVFKQWGFGPIALGLAFIPIAIGYFIAYFSFLPVIRRHTQQRKKDPDSLTPESRLWWLLYMAPLETIGLFGFAWTSFGPPLPWIAPLLFSALVGIANYSIYMATIDYMVASYGPYSASATGGNALARDFLAGIAALYAGPLYSNIGSRPLENATTVLACLAFLVTIPIYVFYWKGPYFREKSPFALGLKAQKRGHGHLERASSTNSSLEKKGAKHVEEKDAGAMV